MSAIVSGGVTNVQELIIQNLTWDSDRRCPGIAKEKNKVEKRAVTFREKEVSAQRWTLGTLCLHYHQDLTISWNKQERI